MKKRKARKRKTGGRQRGQVLKAHKAVPKEVATYWENLASDVKQKALPGVTDLDALVRERHLGIASKGDFSQEVAMAAVFLGKLVEEYKWVLETNRQGLELNRTQIEIPLPMLPGDLDESLKPRVEEKIRKQYLDLVRKDELGERYLKEQIEDEIGKVKFDKTHLHYLHESGHAAIWAMQRGNLHKALHFLSTLIRAAAIKDVPFFKELTRRIECDVPLNSPVNSVISALVGLKEKYLKGGVSGRPDDGYSNFFKWNTPLLFPALLLPPPQRPPLNEPQIAEWVWVYAKKRLSARALLRQADLIEIPRERSRGRAKQLK
jgi:hypothetical protein